jgi:hypothetical protein
MALINRFTAHSFLPTTQCLPAWQPTWTNMMEMVAKARAVPDFKLLKNKLLSKSIGRGIASHKTYIRSGLTNGEPVEKG